MRNNIRQTVSQVLRAFLDYSAAQTTNQKENPVFRPPLHQPVAQVLIYSDTTYEQKAQHVVVQFIESKASNVRSAVQGITTSTSSMEVHFWEYSFNTTLILPLHSRT